LIKPTIFFAMLCSLRVIAPCGYAQSSPGFENQVFSTWLKSSSTGVARPKMVTDTRTLLFS